MPAPIPNSSTATADLRGYKQDLYEGGIRTPMIARWPGKIRAGVTSAFVGAFWDVMPTLCEIAGAQTPEDIDGISVVPTLLGRPGQKPHEFLYWEYHSGGRAFKPSASGNWKADPQPRHDSARRHSRTCTTLATDPSEKINVAGQRPELAAKAAAYMKAAHRPSWEPKWNFSADQ